MAVYRQEEYQNEDIHTGTVRNGMNVIGSDGGSVGFVREVWAYVPAYGYVRRSHFAVADYGPVRGTMHLLEGADGYAHVVPRQGLGRENDVDLFIPLGDLRDIVPGRAVIAELAQGHCRSEYASRPAWLP